MEDTLLSSSDNKTLVCLHSLSPSFRHLREKILFFIKKPQGDLTFLNVLVCLNSMPRCFEAFSELKNFGSFSQWLNCMMEKLGDLMVHFIKINRYPDFRSVTVQLAFQKFSYLLWEISMGLVRWIMSSLESMWQFERSAPPFPSTSFFTCKLHNNHSIPLFILMRIRNGNTDPVGQKCPKK